MGQASRVIFIGNISFDLSEQQIIDIFKDVGPILNFKLMFDRETGKPRGFAFCEYADVETANSAIRNLNGYEINGRTLKVDYADQDTPLTGGIHPQQQQQHHSSQHHIQQSSAAGVGASGAGTFIPLNNLTNQSFTTVEAVNATLASLSNQQLHELLMHAKNLSLNDPAQAKAFLEANPAMSYALLQAMLLMNAVDPRVAQQILGNNYNKQQQSPTLQPQQSSSSSASSKSATQQQPQQQQNEPAEDQQKLIETIMALDDTQIAALPKEQQDQIRAIKAQFSR